MRSTFHWTNKRDDDVDSRDRRDSARALVADGCRIRPRHCWRRRSPSSKKSSLQLIQLPPQEQFPPLPLLVGAYAFVLLMLFGYLFIGVAPTERHSAGSGSPRSRPEANRQELMPTAAHFIYIPGVLLIGIVIGWILGSRAAADAYAAKAAEKEQEHARFRRRLLPSRGLQPSARLFLGPRMPRTSQSRRDDFRLRSCHVVGDSHHRERPAARCRAYRTLRADHHRAVDPLPRS